MDLPRLLWNPLTFLADIQRLLATIILSHICRSARVMRTLLRSNDRRIYARGLQKGVSS